MKKCPKCSKTFDDDKRFCQVDGTPLVDDAVEPDDIYKTIVQSDRPFERPSTPQQVNPMFSKPAEDDLLQIPQQDDPMKTMIAADLKKDSPFQSNAPMAGSSDMNAPSFGDLSSSKREEPPQKVESPFTTPPPSSSPFNPPNTPAPSPFDPPPPYKQPTFDAPPKPFEQTPFGGNQPIAPAGSEWTPPPAPVSNWQNQQIDSNTPFNPPVAGVEGQNKTLATVSLVSGILSICLCGAIAGIPAIITGYMAKNNIKSQPSVYGGATFATIGMILGGVSLLLTLLYFIYIFVMGGSSLLR